MIPDDAERYVLHVRPVLICLKKVCCNVLLNIADALRHTRSQLTSMIFTEGTTAFIVEALTFQVLFAILFN